MELLTLKRDELCFNDIPLLNFKTKLPLLISFNNEVILGNSIRNCYKEEVTCIRINCCDFLKKCLYNMERLLVEENNIQRLYQLEKELMDFINSELKVVEEQDNLFVFRETRFINEDNYNKPPSYNFEKHKSKKKGDDDSVSLFSCFGEL